MLLVPDENRLVLQTLLLFLSDISKNHKVNQMNRTNLAVCFGPVIFSLNYDSAAKKKLKSASSKMMSAVAASSVAHRYRMATPQQSAQHLLNVNSGEEATNYRKLSEQVLGSNSCQSSSSCLDPSSAGTSMDKRSSMFETKPSGLIGPRIPDYSHSN